MRVGLLVTLARPSYEARTTLDDRVILMNVYALQTVNYFADSATM